MLLEGKIIDDHKQQYKKNGKFHSNKKISTYQLIFEMNGR
jgi:hypothetical protein